MVEEKRNPVRFWVDCLSDVGAHVHHRVLVVIQDDDMRMTFVDVLDELGYVVSATRDPGEALVQLAATPVPAAIVLDMPVGLPGVPALYAALRTRPELVDTAVFLFDELELPPAAERPGLVHMFDHPVSLSTLVPALDAVLGR